MKQMSDKEFVESVIMQRMELCYSRWKDGKSSDKKDDYDEIEKADEKAIFLLSETDKKAIKKYIDSMFDDSAEESKFFYRAGIRDGYNLHCKIVEIEESKNKECVISPK